MKRSLIIISVALLILKTNVTLSQTAGFLEFSPDAHSLSVGGTGVAADPNAFAIFNNSSSMVFAEDKMSVSTFYTKWLPNTVNSSIIGCAGFYRINPKFALSFGYRKIGYQAYDIVDVNGNITGTFSPKESALGVGVAYKISQNFSTAINVHHFSSKLSSDKASSLTSDIGFMYRMNSINLGLKMANFGSKVNYGSEDHSLPLNLQLGAGFKPLKTENTYLNVNVSAGYVFSYSSIIAGVAGEYNYKNMVAFRLGAKYGDKSKGVPSHLSTGLGFFFKGFNIDFAYLIAGNDSPINNTLSFCIGYRF